MTKPFKKYIRMICIDLKRHFFAHEYEMNLRWEEKDQTREEGGKDLVVGASIDIDNRYLNFTIHLPPFLFDLYKRGDGDKIASTLVHEFSHLMTEPLYCLAVDSINNSQVKMLEEIRERQTQRISNIVFANLSKKMIKKWELPKPKKKDEPHKTRRR